MPCVKVAGIWLWLDSGIAPCKIEDSSYFFKRKIVIMSAILNKPPVNLGFHNLRVYYRGPMAKPGGESGDFMMAAFQFEADASPLFPYINAVAEKVELHSDPDLIRFYFQGSTCVLYPDYCLISPIKDRAHARQFVTDLMAFLTDIARRRKTIKPKHKLFRKVSVLEILKLLPQNNCRECGFATCMAFAAILSQQQTIPARCPYMGLPLTETVTYAVYGEGGEPSSTLTLDVDWAQTGAELNTQAAYIRQLEERLAAISEHRSQEGREANAQLPTPLTDREIEVLRLISNGATNTEISQLLGISAHTVKSHVINIFNKLAVNDRTQAAVWAAQHKFV